MKRNPVKPQLVCFRRWSRKAYAAFCSVGKCVVIGFLRKSIADVSLKKQPNGCTLLTAPHPERKDGREGEAPEKDSPSGGGAWPIGGEAWLLSDCPVLPQRAAAGAGLLFLDANGENRAGWVHGHPSGFLCNHKKEVNDVGRD